MPNSLTQLLHKYRKHGATRFFAKELAPNDNSKNQIYLAGDFSVLNVLPHSQIIEDTSKIASSIRDRSKAQLDFYWANDSSIIQAPNTKLILYPKYPEVRLSGFLLGCKGAPNKILTARAHGRILVLAVSPDKKIIAEVFDKSEESANIIRNAIVDGNRIGALFEISDEHNDEVALISKLQSIHAGGWHNAVKLSGGKITSYAAQNAGGYTLEALLGIDANSSAGPDIYGWEVKQYAVNDFIRFTAKSFVTLFTPEPDDGFYRNGGVKAFVEKYGYADKRGIPGRRNFGGIYNTKKSFHPDTGLKLVLHGYDEKKLRITDTDGYVALVDKNDDIAASWSFGAILRHWTTKHSKAAYIPSLKNSPPLQFAFGHQIEICQQTDALLFLKALSEGRVNYDPAIKIVTNLGTNTQVKRRSQFRIAHKGLSTLYHQSKSINLHSMLDI